MNSLPPTTRWPFFPLFLIRTTGFPIDWLAELRHEETYRAVAAFLDLEEGREALSRRFTDELFPKLIEDGESRGLDRSYFRACFRLRRLVMQHAPCPPERVSFLDSISIESWVESWNTTLTRSAVSMEEITARLTRELAQTRQTLHRRAQDPKVQEALFLCSANMYRRGVRAYLGHFNKDKRTSRIKKIERRLYGYLQRFCAKNETAGFFGPVDYGMLDPNQDTGLVLERLPERKLQKRLSRLSHWAVQALADIISKEPAVRPYLTPRLPYHYRLEKDGRLLDTENLVYIPLERGEKKAIGLVNDLRTMSDIITAGSDYLEALQSLERKGHIHLGLEIPTAHFDPLGRLCEQITGLPPECETRLRWLQPLKTLAEEVKLFSTQSLENKDAALEHIEEKVRRWTGLEGQRGAGRIYADRLMLFEEALGDVRHCVAGRHTIAHLDEELSPVMDLSASYSLVIQKAYHRRGLGLFQELNQGKPVPFPAFAARFNAEVHLADCLKDPDVVSFRRALVTLVKNRGSDDRTVHLTREDLAPLLLPVPPGTMVSPDIFLAASGPEQIEQGDYRIYLGEIHYGAQAWSHLCVFREDRAELEAVLAGMLPPCPEDTIRVNKVLARHMGKVFYPKLPGYSYEGLGRSARPRHLVFPYSQLEVALKDDRLGLYHDGRRAEVYPDDRHTPTNWLFGGPPVVVAPVRTGSHTPRIMLGKVVYQRARWDPDVTPWKRLIGLRDARLMIEAERLRRACGLPVRCFATLAGEPKAFYVDFATLFNMEFLAARLRGCDKIYFTELLPDERDLWFSGPGGRYGCELRFTAVARS
ncbi:MAG: lantibiotic dehydratase [Acidobacteriota bacterium]|nr:lantibiotic dehydratase [Acidobacteriota bacterium]